MIQDIKNSISFIYGEIRREGIAGALTSRKLFFIKSLNYHLNAIESIYNLSNSNKVVVCRNIVEIDEALRTEIQSDIEEDKKIYFTLSTSMLNFEDEIEKAIKLMMEFDSKVEILIPTKFPYLPEFEIVEKFDSGDIVNLYDDVSHINCLCQDAGKEYLNSTMLGFVLMAGGGGTRFKNSISDLKHNPDDPHNKEIIDYLTTSGILDGIDENIAKVVTPMSAIMKKSGFEENIESVASIIRDYNIDMPVVVIVGPTTKEPVSKMLLENNNFGIRNVAIIQQGNLPFINEQDNKIIDFEGQILHGSNGGGGTLLALGLNGLTDSSGNEIPCQSTLEWFKSFGVKDILFNQTDDARDRELYIGYTGAMNICRKQGKKSIVILGGHYPHSYSMTEKSGKEIIDADYKIGSLWDYFDAKHDLVKTAIVEYAELSEDQKTNLIDIIQDKSEGTIVGNNAGYMLDIELAEKIIKENSLPLHFQFGKREKAFEKETRKEIDFKVTKSEFFMTDLVETASTDGYNIAVNMVRDTSTLKGDLQYINVDCTPIKDAYKLMLSQKSKVFKDSIKAKNLGFIVSELAVVEISSLAIIEDVGSNVKICDHGRIYIGGSMNKEAKTAFGNDIIVESGATLIISGTESVNVPSGTTFLAGKTYKMKKNIVVAIDGPSGAGKSTLAKRIANKLGIMYLDTGAMYRAYALKVIRINIDTLDKDAVEELSNDIEIDIHYENDGSQKVILDGEEVTSLIRSPEVTKGASDVSSFPKVRMKLVELQRDIAARNSVVMDGRDIGTFVLPNADLKVFLTASVHERASRRYEEMKLNGYKEVTHDSIVADLEYRDKNDSSRALAPLLKAEDAYSVDTTANTPDETFEQVYNLVKKVLGGAYA
jgi:cytidylate kinase